MSVSWVLEVEQILVNPVSRRIMTAASEYDHRRSALTRLASRTGASLRFSDISVDVKGKRVLNGVSGAVERGELLAVMGPSGTFWGGGSNFSFGNLWSFQIRSWCNLGYPPDLWCLQCQQHTHYFFRVLQNLHRPMFSAAFNKRSRNESIRSKI